ncbi:MAG: Asp-tRNA(Asn)/Glu-tRNA(Gln) amidotransferase subunit GatB [Aquabacterium sp.]|nr:Asp-tRNA(Asn)/Glu-tRNA(Gln) amidotransferase subunit GatB [Aquabacterium sp.]
MSSLLIRGYEVVIGLETHVQLSTQSQIFSGASTQFGAEPNTQSCPVDLALPGTLPVMNKGAVERAIAFGLSVGSHIAPRSIFARKNYFYPDLPKGYQISQYEIPVVQGGTVSFFVGDKEHTVRLVRAHLEEDAGKSLHDDFIGFNGEKSSGIDLNRAGTPLIEIVTEPDIRTSTEAAEYARALHTLVVWLGICDGNMQEGSFRCDVNISVRKPGAPLGTRREIKNLNSFKHIVQAADYEINWQIDELEDGRAIQQATVLFNPDTGETRAMRTKEDAHDYRYFPDPDLPPLVISPEWVERVRSEMPELPRVMAARFERDYGLPAYDASLMTQSKAFGAFFEAAAKACKEPKIVANWLMGEVSKRLNSEDRDISNSPVSATLLAALIRRIKDGTISNNAAKTVFDVLWASGVLVGHSLPDRFADQAVADLAEELAEIDKVIDAKGLKQMSDTGELEKILDDILAANAKSVEEFRAGKEKAFNALVGQAMKATKGKANPATVNELLKKKLAG